MAAILPGQSCFAAGVGGAHGCVARRPCAGAPDHGRCRVGWPGARFPGPGLRACVDVQPPEVGGRRGAGERHPARSGTGPGCRSGAAASKRNAFERTHARVVHACNVRCLRSGGQAGSRPALPRGCLGARGSGARGDPGCKSRLRSAATLRAGLYPCLAGAPPGHQAAAGRLD